ncbi:MAG: T9SS type A sorting domain-containing protein, partial [Muribaculaceae bacterium]
TQHSADRNHPFSIAFYGETDGRLDESKCFGRIDSDVEAQFGKVGLGYEHPAQWGFIVEDAHATVEGAFYVAFEFADNMPIESPDPNITRSYVALSVVQHGSQETTIYGKAKAGAEPNFVPDGGWYRLDEIDPSMNAGYGTYLVLWCDLNKHDGVVAIDHTGNTVFDVMVDGSTLHVSGTSEGERLAVYALNGAQVLTASASEGVTAIDVAALPRGVYMVVTAAGARKFVR